MERTVIIEKMIDEKWSSRRKFAEYIGIPSTTLQSILKRGVGNASIDNVIKICKGLEITVDELEEMSLNENFEIKEPEAKYHVEIKDKGFKQYFYFPIAVSAGLPINIESIEDAETINIPDALLGKHAGSDEIFFMRVNGESMNKVMPHDSLIAVKQITVDDIKDGDIVVYSDCYSYSVKRFYEGEDKFIFKPESTDPKFTDNIIEKTSEELRLHGKVVIYIVNLD